MYYSIYDLVGIKVDDSYPWFETLFISDDVSIKGESNYNKCRRKIVIDYSVTLDTSDVRFIGDGAYISDSVYVDEEYGVRFERFPDYYRLAVKQECNEWLVIAIQLALLSCNYTMIHAAAVEKNGDVLVMPSWGGVGKTATVSKFVREYGWRLVGDDLVIVGENRILPFLKPFVLYPYHRELFPDAFKQNGSMTVKNLRISNFMSNMIPTVKRLLRPFPRLLAFLRKHNPQSIRVSPRMLFVEEQLSEGGNPVKAVWLERIMRGEVHYNLVDVEVLISKTIAVTCSELFADKIDSVFHMCGCGMFAFYDIFNKMHEILKGTLINIPTNCLEIPVNISINNVGELIYSSVIS